MLHPNSVINLKGQEMVNRVEKQISTKEKCFKIASSLLQDNFT